jgi:hypothetical protein
MRSELSCSSRGSHLRLNRRKKFRTALQFPVVYVTHDQDVSAIMVAAAINRVLGCFQGNVGIDIF